MKILESLTVRSRILFISMINLLILSICDKTLFAQCYPGGVSSGIELWLRADNQVYEDRNGRTVGTNPAEDGDSVFSWGDYAGVRVHAATNLSTGSSPIYRSNNNNNLNFNPVVDFDGINNGLDFGDDYIFSSGTGLTIFSAVRPDSTVLSKNHQFIVDFGFLDDEGYGLAYGFPNVRGYTSALYSDGQVIKNHSHGTTPAIPRFDVNFGGSQSISINGMQVKIGDATGLSQLTAAEINENPTPVLTEGPVMIGKLAKLFQLNKNNIRALDGSLGDVLIYSENLTNNEMSRVESYLAIKYGITLGSTSNPINYLNSSSNIIWDNSSVFQNDIAGIGRDDLSCLSQLQSKSQNRDAIITVGLNNIAASNFSNSNSFPTDMSFLVWGNNNEYLDSDGVSDYGITTNGDNIVARLKRVWLFQETGVVDSVKIRVDLSQILGSNGIRGNNDLSDIRLLVDTDQTFASGALSIPASNYDNSTDIIEFDHDFNNSSGYYISIGTVDYNNAPLPVVFKNFVVDKTETGSLLKWTTEQEKNNGYFLVQASTNLKEWSNVSQVDATLGQSQTNSYQFLHKDEGTNNSDIIYYRVLQVDLDGHKFISDIVSYNHYSDTQTLGLSLFPNPVQNKALKILYQGNKSDINKVEVYNTHGRLFYESHDAKDSVSVDSLPSGQYVLVLYLLDDIKRVRFTVL